MKNFLLSLVLVTSTILQAEATGLVTNTNQSAMFTRLQNRNASTGIDAVYYNPAGLPKLGDGFFVSLNNQTVNQTKTIKTSFPSLNGTPKEYVGNVSAPLYPGIYAAYNMGNLSFSAGFNPIGGGGGAKYDDGLPSFEMPISQIPALLTSQGIQTNRYSADIFFEGSSIFFGYQVNIAYKINEQISIGAGIRMVTAKNTYEGSITNIRINPNQTKFGADFNGSNMVFARDFFQAGNNVYSQVSDGLTALGLPAATPLSALPPQTQDQIAALLGLTPEVIAAMNVGQAIGGLNNVAQAMAENKASTQDRYVDAEQTGTGFTPILSVNYSPSNKFNFSLRYEFKTKLELTTKLNDNKGGGVFVDGKKSVADMPAMLALGAEAKPIDKLTISASFNTYFDKKVDYSGGDDIKMIDRNYFEYGLGVEYRFTDKFRASAGWLATNTGILPEYQNDQRYSSNSNSFGFGVGYRILPLMDINVGGQYTINADYKKPYENGLYTETYGKETFIFAIGLDFYFGKK